MMNGPGKWDSNQHSVIYLVMQKIYGNKKYTSVGFLLITRASIIKMKGHLYKLVLEATVLPQIMQQFSWCDHEKSLAVFARRGLLSQVSWTSATTSGAIMRILFLLMLKWFQEWIFIWLCPWSLHIQLIQTSSSRASSQLYSAF